MASQHTYLSILKRKNRGLFYIILFYIIISLTFALRNEMIFFFRWSMYSKPHHYRDEFPVTMIEYNNGQHFNIPATWKDHKKMMFYYTITHYSETVANGNKEKHQDRAEEIAGLMSLPPLPFNKVYTSPAELEAYPVWLKRYMQANMEEHIDSISVQRVWLKYKDDGRVEVVKKATLFKQ